MNRFPEEKISDLAASYERQMAGQVWGDDLQSCGAVNICANCQQSCGRLNHIPEFGFRGCDLCYDEVMEIMHKEAAELLQTAPAACGRDRESLKGDQVILDPLAVEGNVA